MTLEPVGGGGSSSTIVLHVNPLQRPRQSLQRTQQHRGHLPVRPPAHKLPRIDVHVQFIRQSQRTVDKFHQYFTYDSGSAAMQALIEDIYDHPVSVVTDGEIERAPPAQQPDSVVHRLHWEGEGGRVGEVLNEALGKLLTNLSITHCSVALSDVVSILAEPLPLDSLEVHNVAADGEVDAMLPPVQLESKESRAGSNVSALSITSCAELDKLFGKVNLPSLISLSLRLHGVANATKFGLLQSAAFGPSTWAKERRTFTLRGQLAPVAKAALESWMDGNGVCFSYEHIF